ncbi:MAG: DNA polymerase III subunit alpha [Actinobacteria bacterium]|nr:DNA polymerase III subunit alpha [Actinomycetota bacterium]
MGVPFVHLHNHTEYSMLDGAARIPDLLEAAAEMGYEALAVTDHGGMYGVIPFYRMALKKGIKPILGVEAYLTLGSRFDRRPAKEDPNYHLLLLAENREGYRNLMKLVTLSFMDGYYYKPRMDKEILREYRDGVIALSACVKGEIAVRLLEDDYEGAKRAAREYLSIFGAENFFLEIMDHGLPEEKKVNPGLVELGKELGVGLVASNDLHYVRREDHIHHDVLLCIQTNSTLDQEDRLRFSSDQFYLKNYEEMSRLFAHLPEALTNAVEIAERCNVELEFGRYLLPKYRVPEGYDLDGYLEKLAWEGLRRRYPEVTPELEERLRHELSVIKEMGFSGYFLIVWDFIKFAKERGIIVGPGRGSAAGSLVSYCLGITTVDPMRYDLLFERFLNPDRRTMPDIDIDFCYKRRPEVIDYVSRKYGKDRVAQIVTFSTMAARAAIRDAGRVYNLEYGKVDRLAKMVPEQLNMTIDKALELSPELREAYESDELARKIIDTARKLEGITRQDSIHAAGVVIADDDLSGYTPLQRRGPDEEVVTQYDMEAIQAIGLLKMDFLGLRTLTVISDTLDNIQRRRGIRLNLEELPLDDPRTFELLQKGDTVGVFQLESPGMRSLLQDLKPERFEDLIAVLALYRPGPLRSGMVKDYVDRRHGRVPVTYLHPDLEPILEQTRGIFIYQEQVMRLAVELAGYSMAEADGLRAVVAKSKAEEMKFHRDKFIGGMVSRGYPRSLAEKLFDLISHFGEYGFNKSHSTAYAVISYQTAYLKAHYPREFMAALLSSVTGNKDKVQVFVNECRKMGIKVLPPDINESFKEFTPVEEGIRFGLAAVRNLGEAPAERIIAVRREGGPFRSLMDFCLRVGQGVINKRTLESLIKSGAFDFLGYSRNHLLKTYERVADLAAEKLRRREEGQHSLFEAAEGEEEPDPVEAQPPLEELTKDQLLAYEKEMLGIYVTDHPLMQYRDTLERQVECDIADLSVLGDGAVKWIGGIITGKTQRITRKGELMAGLVLEDLTGRVEVTVFPALYMQYRDALKEDNIICLRARVEARSRPDSREGEEEVATVRVVALEIAEPRLKSPEECDLFIRLEDGQLERETMDRLKDILARHPGGTTVKLELRSGDSLRIFKLPDGLCVNPDGSLYAEVLSLLGEGCISLR